MLRAATVRTYNTASISFTITHNLGQIPDAYWLVHSAASPAVGHDYIPVAGVLTNAMTIYNSQASAVTVTLFTIFYNGRLY